MRLAVLMRVVEWLQSRLHTAALQCGRFCPLSGSSRLSVEEGLIRSIAVDAVGYGRNVLYDQTLARNAGIGRLYNQTYSCHTPPSAARLMSAILIAPPALRQRL